MNRKLFILGLAATTVMSAPAHAVTTFTDLSSWQSSVASYERDTDYGANYDDISSVSLNGGANVSFSSSVNIRNIGSGWGTWSGGYTGQVLYTGGGTSITGTFNTAVDAFGFFSEPDPFSIHKFTLTLSDGSSVSGDFNGASGAGFLGWAGAGITSFTISSDVDFAFGDFYVGQVQSAVPEPESWAMMIVGFGLVGAAMRRKVAKTAIA